MAACTHAVGTADTGASPNTSGAFTPSANDLLVVFVVASDTTDAAGTLSSSVGGQSFAFILKATYATSAHAIYCFVANALSTAVSQTVTWTESSVASTGTVIFVCRVSGMTRKGTAAVRQTAKQDNQGVGTPAPAFSVAALTGNPCLGVMANTTASLTMTPPTGWTEPAGGETSYTVPSIGSEYVFRDSGFTGTTVTWGSSSLSVFGSMIVEMDTSAAVNGARKGPPPIQPILG